MNTKSLAAGLLLTAVPTLAHAIDVYPGCPAPALKSGHHTFYVDPIKGTADGNGSAAKPWKSLDTVVGVYNKLLNTQQWSNAKQAYATVNPNGPVKPGDVIMLMSGDYGSQKILNAFNTDFVWLMAAPGQTPVMNQINIVSSGKWVIQGIKFLGGSPTVVTDVTKKPLDGQANVGYGDYTGNTDSIVFNGNTFATVDDASHWSDFDWIAKPYFTTFKGLGTCVSLVNNTFHNVLNAVQMSKPRGLMAWNHISYFSNDGVDVTEGYITIRGNTFTTSKNNLTDPYHPDAIQGWSNRLGNGYATNTNVLIEKNSIAHYGDWHKTYLQGISIWDGKWENLIIQNNSIISNTLNGITVFGANNSRVENNTIVTTNDAQTWIRIANAKDGTPSQNVVVRNNIAPVIAADQPGASYDHNIFTIKLIGKQNNTTTTFTKSGQISTQSTLVPVLGQLFEKADVNARSFDLRLKAGSPAIGAGSSSNAPTDDVFGKARKAPIDIGAYAK